MSSGYVKYIYFLKANGQCVSRKHHRVLAFLQQMCQRAAEVISGVTSLPGNRERWHLHSPPTQLSLFLSLSLSVSVFPSHHALFICRELWNEMGKILQEPLTLCIDNTECCRAVMRRPWVHLVQFLRKWICTSNLCGLKTDKHFISLAAPQTRFICSEQQKEFFQNMSQWSTNIFVKSLKTWKGKEKLKPSPLEFTDSVV